uniref:NADH dehydrogenase [ubiquinone] 1 beta subcomplex subunit 9 n=1 Tax=Lygus hesperus TaxID=30085 RepID=A0A0A9W0G0_LYGHE
MASHIPTKVLNNKQKVLSLYKRALRNLESWNGWRLDYRYQAVLMRARFDENRNIKNEKKIAELLNDGEEELFRRMHWQPKKFANTIGGNNYGRAHETPDWVLDYWHPLEKAQYPEYFARREKRKEEFIRNWIKEHGPLEQGHH